jgi:hypothetical protein
MATPKSEPLTYSLDEARKRLREPPLGKTTMYELVSSGVLEVSGYFGDRPFFTDAALQACAARLSERTSSRVPQPAPRMRRSAPSRTPTDR